MHTLLSHAIDYAGLFPPASLELASTLEHETAYRRSQDAWALGRLILPVSALAALEQSDDTKDMAISVVLGSDPERDLERISGRSRPYDLFECKLAGTDRIAPIMRKLPAGAKIFFEVDAASALSETFAAIRQAGASAKIRTGGTNASAIPCAADVARFLTACASHRLAFKATAGLHHPLRGQYRLTYQSDSPTATMHGFVNVIFAAALAYFEASEQDICAVLNETSADAFVFAPQGLCWRDCRLTVEQLAEVRQRFFTGFGSCSFTEPIEESRALGWLA